MSNSLGYVVPMYAAPADWQYAEVDPNLAAFPGLKVVRTGTYITDQAALDALVAWNEGDPYVPLVFLTLPPMGFVTDIRLSNPNAYYPTPALIAEQISRAAQVATGAQAASDAASTSATDAATSATNAANSATAAGTSATDAQTSANSAASSAAAAEAVGSTNDGIVKGLVNDGTTPSLTRAALDILYAGGTGTSVKDPRFAATGDGTTNDTAAVQAVLDLGGTVFIPPGTYLVDLLGSGADRQHVVLAPGATLVSTGISHVLNVTHNNFTVGGLGTIDGATSPGAGVMVNAGVTDTKVRDLELVNGAYGVRCKGSTGPIAQRLLVDHTHIHGSSSHGVFLNWETTDSEITHNDIHDVGGNGVWLGNTSTGNKVMFNNITNSGRIGIENFGGSAKNTILGNIIDGCTSMGISMDTSDGSRIAFNHILNAGSYGMECAASNKCVYEGNVIITPASHGISVSALTAGASCDDNTFSHNVIDHPGGNGIMCGGSSQGAKRLRITGNEIIEPGNGLGNATGIDGVFNLGCENWVVANNTIRWVTNAVSTSGVIINGPGCQVTGNTFIYETTIGTNIGGTAISVPGEGVNTLVSGNTVIGNGMVHKGVTVNSAATGTMVSTNNIFGTTQAIIDATGCDSTVVISNNNGSLVSGAAFTMASAVGGGNKVTTHSYVEYFGGHKFTGNVGFNGTNPIAQPTVTGSRGGNAALASLVTALASYGLVIDSTTA